MTRKPNGRPKTGASRQQVEPPPAQAEPPLSPARAFVVQFREPSPAGGARFAGRAEHMITGAAARFESPEELLAFLVRTLNAVPRRRARRGQPDR